GTERCRVTISTTAAPLRTSAHPQAPSPQEDPPTGHSDRSGREAAFVPEKGERVQVLPMPRSGVTRPEPALCCAPGSQAEYAMKYWSPSQPLGMCSALDEGGIWW